MSTVVAAEVVRAALAPATMSARAIATRGVHSSFFRILDFTSCLLAGVSARAPSGGWSPAPWIQHGDPSRLPPMMEIHHLAGEFAPPGIRGLARASHTLEGEAESRLRAWPRSSRREPAGTADGNGDVQ